MKIVTKLRNEFRQKILKLPTQVVLEPTNRCNLNCPYCMVGVHTKLVAEHGSAAHEYMHRPQGCMDEETFFAVMRHLKQFGILKVYLHFQGEPFLNPLLPRFARILKSNRFNVGVFTNGMALHGKNIQEIADAEVDLIRFSVDGATNVSYAQNRVGGNFERVFENMRLTALAHRGKATRIEWQFLALRNNEHEIEQAQALAQKIGVHFFVKGFRDTDTELNPRNARFQAQFLKKPCKDIYRQLGIYWNGDVVPCCYDTDASEVMGNVVKNSLMDIWNSPKYREFRSRVDNALTRPQAEPDICKACLRWR